MNCSNCGNEIPMGQPACPYCGAPAPVDMNMNMNMGMDMGMQQPYQAAPAYAAAPAPAGNKKGLIIGLIAGAALIVAVVLILVFFVFGGGDADGTYVCSDYALFGINMEIEIDGDEFVMTMESTYDDETETIEGECEVKGDEIILTYDGEDLACPYDAKEGTIDFEGMIFTKEK